MMSGLFNEKKKWRIIFWENYLQMLFLVSLCVMLISHMWSIFGYASAALLPISIIDILIIMPPIILKIKFRIRIGNYLKIKEKGNNYIAQLDLIEDANVFGDRWLGDTQRYIFHFKVLCNGYWLHGKYTVVCTEIDSTVLGLKKYNQQYIVSENTTIPIVKYKDKMVVLQNECGFYDLAHNSSNFRVWQEYW